MKEDFQRYKDLFDTMDLGVVFHNEKGEIIEINKALAKILNFSAKKAVGSNIIPDEWKMFKENGDEYSMEELPAYLSLKTGRTIQDVVIKIQNTRSNVEKWIKVNSTPEFKKGEKKVFRIYSTIQDITEQRNSLSELRSSEEKFRKFFENEPGYCYMVSNEGLILDVNQSALKALGYKRKELIGKSIASKIYSKNSRAKVETLLNKWKKSGILENEELIIITKKGEERTVLLSADAIRDIDGKIISSISVQRDITEQKKVEEKLKLTHSGIESSQLALFQIDDSGNIIDTNNQACKSLGYTCQQLKKMKVWEIDSTFNQKSWKEHRKRTRTLGNTHIESIHRRKDGTEFPVEITTNFIEYENRGISFSLAKDISERKRIEKISKENDKRFRDIFNQSTIGIGYYDKEGNCIEINRAACKIFGIENVRHAAAFKLFEDPNISKEHLSNLKKGNTIHYVSEFDFDLVKKHNLYPTSKTGVIITKVSVSPIFEDNKKISGYIGQVQDITENWKAEEILVESEEKFRSLAEESPNMIFINQNGRIVYVNKICEKFTLYTSEELTRENFYFLSLIDTEYHDFVKTKFREHSSGKNIPPYEYRIINKQGEKLDVINSTKIISYQKKPAILGIVTDITDRKRAELALKESESYLLKAQEIAKAGHYIYDFQADKFTSSKVVDSILEIGPDFSYDIAGWQQLIHPDYREEMNNYFMNEVIGKKQAFDKTYKIVGLKNGTERWVHGLGELILDDKGNVAKMIGSIQDITESKSAEEALKRSEEKLSAFMNAATDSFYLLDHNLNFIAVNENALKIMNNKPEDVVGKNIKEVVPDIVESGRYAQHLKVLNTGIPFEIEDFVPHPVFGNRHFTLKSFKVQDGLGVIVSDITKRKQAEQQLRENEEKYRFLLNSQSDAVLLHPFNENKFENITEVNDVACKIYGYSKEEFLKLTAENITAKERIAPQDVAEKKKMLKKEGNLVFETENIKRSGERFPVEISMNLITLKDKQYTLSVVRDITERKIAERALQDSEEKFRRIFEEGQFGITIAGPDFKFVNANPAFCKMIGYTVDELKSKTFADITHPDRVKDDSEKVKDLMQGKIKLIKVEKEYIRKNGTVLWGSLISTAIHNDDGSVIYYLAMVQDITDRKKTERILKKQMKEYQKLNENYKIQNKELIDSLGRIQIINEELEAARSKAEESDHLKTAFLANMSHEIRTPMNGIMGFSELLRNEFLEKSDQERYIDIIQQSGERMLNIINDLIDISKIEARQMDIKLEETEVNKLLENLLNFFQPETKNKDLELILDPFPQIENSLITTDKTKLTQILSNLIKNSIKYSKEGQINFGYSLKGNNLEFYVKDTGIGIKPEIQDKIFERFRQADLSATRPYEGAGLGLSISKSFVEMLDGKIWLESEPDKGSTFFFTIPYDVSDKVESMTTTTEVINTNELKKITILIAEDDITSLLFLREILHESETTTLHARNGEEAIRLVETHPEIRLVLMDIKMPLMNGYDATRRIKELRPHLPVIAQTAFASSIDKQKSIDAGCDDYISKPIKREKLLEIIGSLI